ncbi:hypothetical protein ACPA9J_00255 [Pseudomonas aeruginosa]
MGPARSRQDYPGAAAGIGVGRPFRDHFRGAVRGQEIRQAVEVAKQHAAQYGRRTILFVDEVHRFNRASRMPSCLVWKTAADLHWRDHREPVLRVEQCAALAGCVYVLKSLDEPPCAQAGGPR